MLTKITLTNFKGIGPEPVEIPIKPLTLLFGGNSAGKSTILHAIAYVREILETGHCDVARTNLGGDSFDLGGFRAMVHDHDEKKNVTARFDFDFDTGREKVELRNFCVFDEELAGRFDEYFINPTTDITSGWIELAIGFQSVVDKHPIVLSYEVGYNDVSFAFVDVVPTREPNIPDRFPSWIKDETKKRYLAQLSRLNFRHPILLNQQDDYNETENIRDRHAPEEMLSHAVHRKEPEGLHVREIEFMTTAEGHEIHLNAEGALDGLLIDMFSSLELFYQDSSFAAWAADFEEIAEIQSSTWTWLIRPIEDFRPGTLFEFPRWCDCIIDGNLEPMEYRHWIGILSETNEVAEQAIVLTGIHNEEECNRYGSIIASLAKIDDQKPNRLYFPFQSDSLPAWKYQLDFFRESEEEENTDAGDNSLARRLLLAQTLDLLIYGPAHYLRECLSKTRYVGPIRKILPRDYSKPAESSPSRWADGLGAWDLLHDLRNDAKDDLNAAVSGWLFRKDGEGVGGLNTRYRLEKEIWHEVSDSGKAGPERCKILLRMQNGVTVHPQEIGVGISQVIPIIVAAVAKDGDICLLEQPELHLHPSQQAAVGDLLIHAAKGRHKIIIAETHSVHLVLRVLRRINESSRKKLRGLESFTRDDLKVLYVCSVENTDTDIMKIAVDKNLLGGRQTRFRGTDIMEIAVDKNGDFLQPWPDDFFEQEFLERFTC